MEKPEAAWYENAINGTVPAPRKYVRDTITQGFGQTFLGYYEAEYALLKLLVESGLYTVAFDTHSSLIQTVSIYVQMADT